MRRRRRIALALVSLVTLAVLTPVAAIELGCSNPLPGSEAGGHVSLLAPHERRPEVRTWLTYPEWHIVYSAEAFGRHLAAGRPPSRYRYGRDIAGFWSSYCGLNRASADAGGASDAKIMIYTIGISFTAELAVKAAYERTIGRLSEALGGWRSADDAHAARVQQAYGAFMHATPWYLFPFWEALRTEWRTSGSGHLLRHSERRFALTAEYGVKAGYAKLIGAASGAALGRDEPTLRLVARGEPRAIAAVDRRLRPVRIQSGLAVIEAPRYAAFTELLQKLAATNVELVEIAGNDDIFVTAHMPTGAAPLPGTQLLSMPLEEPSRHRVGISTKVVQLLPLMRAVERAGGTVEHVYDY